MNRQEIDLLISSGFSDRGKTIELEETHISWVLLTPLFAFKIKKPVKYPFLDFTTLEKRRYYCEKEVILNNRLTEGIYLGVLPIWRYHDRFTIGDEGPGTLIDYTVHMKRLDAGRRMDKLLVTGRVKEKDAEAVVEKLIPFHKDAMRNYTADPNEVGAKFNELIKEETFLKKEGLSSGMIREALTVSDKFMAEQQPLMKKRLKDGYIRDVHGDLHSRNIFLNDEPVVFDCIEFNDDLRQIDLLNELAFFCMDLEAFNQHHLSSHFFRHYNMLYPVCDGPEEERLFVYYKAYRANVRAKVNSLRAKSADTREGREAALKEAEKYLKLMRGYMHVVAGKERVLVFRPGII